MTYAPTPTLVDHTCPCITCGYDLLGLSPSDRCPECGVHVRHSHHGPTLDRTDRAWVRRVGSGQRQIAWATTLLTGAMPLVVGAYLLFALHAFDDWRTLFRVSGAVIGPFVAIGFTLLISGGVRVTAREPGDAPSMPERRACRGFLIALLTLGALLAPMPLVFPTFDRPTSIIGYTVDGLLLALVGCALLLAHYASTYLARLAVRVPDASMARRVRTSARVLVGSAALVALSVVPSYTHDLRWTQTPDAYFIGLFALLLVVAIGASVRFSRVMHTLARAIRSVKPADV